MKKVKVLFLIVFLGLNIFCLDVKLISMSGTVQVKENEKAQWVLAKEGQILESGFYIYTGLKSLAIIEQGKTKIEIKPLTQATISSILQSGDTIATDVLLKYGKIKATVEKVENAKTMFKVRSANSTASVRGTVFVFGEDTLEVERGTVFFIGDNQNSTLVQSGEKSLYYNFDVISSPFVESGNQYYIDALPFGLTDTESKGDTNLNTNKKQSTNSFVKIKINVTE